MNFNFGEVLTRAWKITWKYRVLWLFGMLASCGQGGNNSSNARNSYNSGNNQLPSEMTRQLEETTHQMTVWFSENQWVIFVLVAVFLFLILLQIFLGTTGTIGLVRGAYHADGGAETLSFGPLFRESLGYFWRMIGLGLVIWLPFFLLFFGSLILMLFATISGVDSRAMGSAMVLFLVGFCCCMFPVMILLSMYYAQAERALLIDDLGIFAAIQRGWKVFTGNLVTLFGIWFILFIVGLLAGILIALPYFIVIFPLMFNFIQGDVQSWQPLINAGIFILIYYPIFWFLSGVLRTYTETIWTLTYLEVRPYPEAPVVLVEANA